MSTASAGRAREHRVAQHMTEAGWTLVMRAAGSKGAADLLMAHETHGAALVQVGTKSKTLGPAERTRLVDAAWLVVGLPIVCQVIEQRGRRTEYRYWHINEGPASQWDRWTP